MYKPFWISNLVYLSGRPSHLSRSLRAYGSKASPFVDPTGDPVASGRMRRPSAVR